MHYIATLILALYCLTWSDTMDTFLYCQGWDEEVTWTECMEWYDDEYICEVIE